MSTTQAMPTTMHAAAVERMRAHARATGALECCGALLGRMSDGGRAITDAVPAANRSDEPARRYLIGPGELLRLEDEARARGFEVVGFYHSHPTGNGAPSPTDIALAWPWYTYMIVAPGAEPCAWRLRADRSGFDAEAIAWVA